MIDTCQECGTAVGRYLDRCPDCGFVPDHGAD
jgi:predicted ATP-dependent serine protease